MQFLLFYADWEVSNDVDSLYYMYTLADKLGIRIGFRSRLVDGLWLRQFLLEVPSFEILVEFTNKASHQLGIANWQQATTSGEFYSDDFIFGNIWRFEPNIAAAHLNALSEQISSNLHTRNNRISSIMINNYFFYFADWEVRIETRQDIEDLRQMYEVADELGIYISQHSFLRNDGLYIRRFVIASPSNDRTVSFIQNRAVKLGIADWQATTGNNFGFESYGNFWKSEPHTLLVQLDTLNSEAAHNLRNRK